MNKILVSKSGAATILVPGFRYQKIAGTPGIPGTGFPGLHAILITKETTYILGNILLYLFGVTQLWHFSAFGWIISET
jgi:hypothetical protein